MLQYSKLVLQYSRPVLLYSKPMLHIVNNVTI